MRRVAVISTYPPRRCGIASFTEGLCASLAPAFDAVVVAVNDPNAEYEYRSPVGFVIQQDEPASYKRGAEFVNACGADLVCVEHEYGIFGGASGAFLLGLLREISIPVVTALHTVPRLPDTTQRHVLLDLIQISKRVIVHGRFGACFLQDVYGTPIEMVDCIPLGVPDLRVEESAEIRETLGLNGHLVLVSIGFLSPNKGIEDVIAAIPAIAAVRPNVCYVVAGTTHPIVKKHDGESYVKKLKKMAKDLRVGDNVLLWNRYLNKTEIRKALLSADLYISPRRDSDLISSGTLALALAAGKAVIATPYWNAIELIQDNAGVVVPFRSPEAISSAVIELMHDDQRREHCERRALLTSQAMVWNEVASQYRACFELAMNGSLTIPTIDVLAPRRSHPPLKLDHLLRLTDDTGITQHAVISVPNRREGYCTDDNARALLLTTLLGATPERRSLGVVRLGSTYLAFLWQAFDQNSKRMRNFLSYDRRWAETVGSEECHGRSLWALGAVMSRSADAGLRDCARQLFESAVTTAETFESSRAWSYAILGIDEHFAGANEIPEATRIHHVLAERLLSLYRCHASAVWPWFEEALTYFNAVLPHALVAAGTSMHRDDMVETGVTALDWLVRLQRGEGGCFSPIGNRGFYHRGMEKAHFDQQPIEAKSLALACIKVHRVIGDDRWQREAMWAFDWFLGRNILGLSLYDHESGGCRDGLHALGANENQGAESTLAFLLSSLGVRGSGDQSNPDGDVSPACIR
jgi:glycosyltransferase involved in cell wall biosynthesis